MTPAEALALLDTLRPQVYVAARPVVGPLLEALAAHVTAQAALVDAQADRLRRYEDAELAARARGAVPRAYELALPGGEAPPRLAQTAEEADRLLDDLVAAGFGAPTTIPLYAWQDAPSGPGLAPASPPAPPPVPPAVVVAEPPRVPEIEGGAS